MNKLLFFVLIILSLVACNNKKIAFQSFKEIPHSNWIRFNTYSFSYDVTDTSSIFDIEMDVKIDSSFYENYLFYYIYMQSPDKAKRYVEKRMQFKDSTNKFLSTCESDSLIFNQKVFTQVKFTAIGKHVFEIGNLMNKYDNIGIHQIGITIKKAEEN